MELVDMFFGIAMVSLLLSYCLAKTISAFTEGRSPRPISTRETRQVPETIIDPYVERMNRLLQVWRENSGYKPPEHHRRWGKVRYKQRDGVWARKSWNRSIGDR